MKSTRFGVIGLTVLAVIGMTSCQTPYHEDGERYVFVASNVNIPYWQEAQAGLTDNMAAALCYLLGVLTGILFLVLEPYNRNKTIRFHAFQSIFLWIAAVALFIGLSIVGFILLAIPFIGAVLSLVLHLGLGFGMLILWIMLMYKAYNNERWVLPIIGPLAEKQA